MSDFKLLAGLVALNIGLLGLPSLTKPVRLPSANRCEAPSIIVNDYEIIYPEYGLTYSLYKPEDLRPRFRDMLICDGGYPIGNCKLTSPTWMH
jgi:hypothetical protein